MGAALDDITKINNIFEYASIKDGNVVNKRSSLATALTDTEDVPREKQIVRFYAGKSAGMANDRILSEGLESVLGQDKYNDLLDQIEFLMDANTRGKYMMKYGNKRDAIKGYLADFLDDVIDENGQLTNKTATKRMVNALRHMMPELDMTEADGKLALVNASMHDAESSDIITNAQRRSKILAVAKEVDKERVSTEVKRFSVAFTASISDTYDQIAASRLMQLREAYQDRMIVVREVQEMLVL